MILALWPPVRQFQLPALLFVCVLFVLFLLVVVALSGEPKQNPGRGLVDRKLVQASSNLIAGRPKAALLKAGNHVVLMIGFAEFRTGIRTQHVRK